MFLWTANPLAFKVRVSPLGRKILISLSHWERVGVRAYNRIEPTRYPVVECHSSRGITIK
jgi:hypothetical protein